jgi:hypothetical protein
VEELLNTIIDRQKAQELKLHSLTNTCEKLSSLQMIDRSFKYFEDDCSIFIIVYRNVDELQVAVKQINNRLDTIRKASSIRLGDEMFVKNCILLIPLHIK